MLGFLLMNFLTCGKIPSQKFASELSSEMAARMTSVFICTLPILRRRVRVFRYAIWLWMLFEVSPRKPTKWWLGVPTTNKQNLSANDALYFVRQVPHRQCPLGPELPLMSRFYCFVQHRYHLFALVGGVSQPTQ